METQSVQTLTYENGLLPTLTLRVCNIKFWSFKLRHNLVKPRPSYYHTP